MYELVHLTGNSFYIRSPAAIGLVRLEGDDVCLIDAGNDRDAGRRVRKVLDGEKMHLTAIYNTHSNADHIGGNQYLQRQTGCRIYAPGIECAFTRWPLLEPSFLYGGCPPKDLRHKFLLAQESPALELTPQDLPSGMELIPLPGHFFDMVGFRTSDSVVYLADCLSSREALDKYVIAFLYDPAAYLQTLEKVKAMEAEWFVPAHAEPAQDIAPLAQYNIDRTLAAADLIVELCAEPRTFESILQALFTRFDLLMTFEQHALVGSTVRSYLAWLRDTGRITARFENNLLLWERV